MDGRSPVDIGTLNNGNNIDKRHYLRSEQLVSYRIILEKGYDVHGTVRRTSVYFHIHTDNFGISHCVSGGQTFIISTNYP